MSVKTTIYALFGALAALALALSAMQVWTGLGTYRTASRTAALAQLDKELFDSTVTVRTQRGNAQSALLGVDNAAGAVDGVKKVIEKEFADARAALARTGLANDEKARTLVSAFEGIAPNYKGLYDEAAKPRAERTIAATQVWYDSTSKFIDALVALSTFVANEVRMGEPAIAEFVQVRRFAWTIRDRYGIQCSLIRANINDSRPLTPAQTTQMNEISGVLQSAWTALDETLARPGAPGTLVLAVRTARASVDAARARIGEAIRQMDGSGKAILAPADWNTLCQGPFAPIIAITNVALDGAIARAGEMENDALRQTIVALAVLASTLVICAIGLVAINRRFQAPVAALLAAINRLTARDYATPVPALRKDEFGATASALESMRLSALEAERLAREEEANRARQIERAKRLEKICREFETGSDATLRDLRGSTEALHKVAAEMRASASDSKAQADSVARAAAQATESVNTVAAATEELSASINEISRQIQTSSAAAKQAVDHVDETTRVVGALDEAARKIGEVVKLINGIADQTNLLALNATIEAARAGDAGKGFAVVASEVKSLATQTGKLTEGITRQVDGIQAATRAAVDAIGRVSTAIVGIDTNVSAIAAAVEEQGAATKEIATNVQQVAEGTREVTATINAVAQSSGRTGEAAQIVTNAVETVSAGTRTLGTDVERFLGDVKSA
jgi:methyl-accepting chemotaxis protein